MLQILLLVLDLGGHLRVRHQRCPAGGQARLDIFGVMVLSFAAGNAGGIMRDILIGAVPPAVADWRYLAVSGLAGLISFFWHPATDRFRDHILWWDAVGLAFFAVAGTEKALLHGLNPVMAPLLGMLTGVGGGMLRDVLVTEIPVCPARGRVRLGGAGWRGGGGGGHALNLPRSRPRWPVGSSAWRCASGRSLPLAPAHRPATAIQGVLIHQARRGSRVSAAPRPGPPPGPGLAGRSRWPRPGRGRLPAGA